ncbi:hypothetical protein HY640_02095 [Candidatus Woesearchaeota archaeon]|nr:hypothetical protein [Candidatus Woesearchaeota archaeon]
MTKTVELLTKHWVWVLCLMVLVTVLGLFFLRPENLVAEHCSIEGFSCTAELVHSSGSLFVELQNLYGGGVMVESLSAGDREKLACGAVFDDGWGPFVSGRHISSRGKEQLVIRCSGMSADDIGAGNKRLEVVLKWYFDNESESFSRLSSGTIFSVVTP